MDISTYIKQAISSLDKIYPSQEAQSIVLRLLEKTLNIPTYKIHSEPHTIIKDVLLQKLNGSLSRLMEYEPVQYVLGETEFANIVFKVKPGVLIPRPETEELFYWIVDDFDSILHKSDAVPIMRLNQAFEKVKGSIEQTKEIDCLPMEVDVDKDFTILDVCTGSGCIAHSLACAIPEAQIFGCDISNDALNVACKQKISQHSTRPVFFYADVLQAPPAGLPKFNVIVSNPPYVLESQKAEMSQNVLKYEPEIALFVPNEDPLKYYKAIVNWAKVLLKEKGYLYFEINELFGDSIEELLINEGFKNVQIAEDINDKDRFVRAEK